MTLGLSWRSGKLYEGRRTHTAVGVTEAAPATRYRALNGCYQIYRGRLATPTVETKRPVAHACYRALNAGYHLYIHNVASYYGAWLVSSLSSSMVAAPVFPSSPPPSSVNGTRPHIVAFLQDDLGWYDAFANLTDIQSAAVGSASANLQALAADGILLLRHYTHWHCSPSRRAFLTGRTPLHHGEQLSDATTHDIDLRWTTIGQKLDRAGYACHYYGKGHTGYMSMKHLPVFQGFSAGTAGFLHGVMGYTEPNRWSGDRPERNRKYSVRLYGDRALAAVAQHDPRTPLFMFLPWQAVHGPCAPATPNPHRRRPSARALFQIASVRALFRPPGRPTRFLYTRRPRIPRRPASVSQAPTRVIPRAPPRLLRPPAADEAPPGYNRSLTGCAAWESEDRCVLYAMYHETDLYMGKVVDALRTKNMYDQTLILFASDNGGTDEGNNYPLRGAKRTNWEGGIRTPAFITGGLVPRELRGTASQVTLSIADWYPTFCNLAGIDPTDDPPVAPLAVDEAQDPSGPLLDIWGQESYPGVDGLDIWPILMNPQAHGHGSAHEVRGRLMVLHLVCISHPALPTDPRRHPLTCAISAPSRCSSSPNILAGALHLERGDHPRRAVQAHRRAALAGGPRRRAWRILRGRRLRVEATKPELDTRPRPEVVHAAVGPARPRKPLPVRCACRPGRAGQPGASAPLQGGEAVAHPQRLPPPSLPRPEPAGLARRVQHELLAGPLEIVWRGDRRAHMRSAGVPRRGCVRCAEQTQGYMGWLAPR